VAEYLPQRNIKLKMEEWVVVRSFTYPHEAHLVKTKLESRGIETQLKDELTVQVHNFYSNAIGGVKLLVRQSDEKDALEILNDSGNTGKDEAAGDENLKRKKLRYSKILYAVAVVILLVAIGTAVYSIFLIPSQSEKLSLNAWCFEGLYYKDWEFTPNTIEPDEVKSSTQIQFEFVNSCREYMVFYKEGIVTLPGFDTEKIKARWKMEEKKLFIIPANGDMSLVNEEKEGIIEGKEVLENIYYGIYDVKFQSIYLTLESEKRIIYGSRKYDNKFSF